MYRVLLVDDEPLVIEGLRSLVDWEKYGFIVSGEALDGEDALALMEDNAPDVVITDIQMPLIDGLELIHQACDRNMPAKFIILSSYDEFAYAKAAMQYQVKHYILKPIDEQEIELALIQIKEELEHERQLRQQETLILQDALARLLRGNEDAGNLEQARSLLNRHTVMNLRFVLMEIHRSRSKHAPAGGAGVGGGKLTEVLNRALAGFVEAFFLFAEEIDQFGLLLIGEKLESEQSGAYLKRIIQCVRANCDCDIFLFASERRNGLEALPALYRQALTVRRETFVDGLGRVYEYSPMSKTGLIPDDEADLLVSSIMTDDRAAVDACIGQIVTRIRREYTSPVIAQAFMAQVEMEMLRRLAGLAGEAASRHGCLYAAEEWRRPSVELFRCSLQAFSEQLLFALHGWKLHHNAVIETIVYVHAHYREKLRLRALADRLHLNPVYLGQLFRKRTGMVFGEYVHHVRIEYAKKLLRRTDWKIAEIARQVGYSDPEYFLRKFKAIAKCLPSVYQKGGSRGMGETS